MGLPIRGLAEKAYVLLLVALGKPLLHCVSDGFVNAFSIGLMVK